MGERCDPFHKFLLVNEGSTQIYSKDCKLFDLAPHHVFFVPAHTAHSLKDLFPTSLLLLCLAPEFPKQLNTFQPVWENLTHLMNHPVLPSGLITQKIEYLWRKGISEQESSSFSKPLSLQLLAMEIMVTLVRAARFPRKENPRQRITQFLELLDTEYYENWDVQRAANMVQLSRRRFSDYFKETTGHSFVEMLTRIRIEKSKELMRIGEFSIAGAGFSSGFNDLSHFYRTFKKYAGVTPGEWLRQQGDPPE